MGDQVEKPVGGLAEQGDGRDVRGDVWWQWSGDARGECVAGRDAVGGDVGRDGRALRVAAEDDLGGGAGVYGVQDLVGGVGDTVGRFRKVQRSGVIDRIHVDRTAAQTGCEGVGELLPDGAGTGW